MTDFATGFTKGQREGARFALDAQADAMQALAGRLTAVPEAIAAANEATAILRDAARRLDFEPSLATAGPATRPGEARPSPPQGRPAARRRAAEGEGEPEAEDANGEASRRRARSKARG